MIMVFLFLKFIYFSESSVIAGVAKFVIHFENNNSERVLSDKSQFLLECYVHRCALRTKTSGFTTCHH
ncbi:TPA: hypothetical protein GE071_01615 [Escherichia coli]|uniref:Uncharacterized protein n=7 Tax=Escherichia coli TaxID=562 RepID=A0A1U9U095_ECOLX|nr:hypothetical protein [Escherichia coli]AXY48125.1 hypothetical protein CIW80_20940 [Escherichia coli Nissle 1917]EFJ54837.1 hypothetical protein HMPREF9549_03755 [Escherichia coli MS 185-1]EFN6672686.1 hypothetical protein [Escherichia coli O8:H10]EFN6919153.1 hypothetical protein [Escherichia coli O8]EFN7194579.1 hypothetical protein [Escherichia coli O2:H1]EFN7204211.1 hypothetical protein [Escherichia coli H1]EFN8413871.1 hypothetical protein [Escherichia coli O150]EFN8565325.1 hypoth